MRNLTKIIIAILLAGALVYILNNEKPTQSEIIIKVKASKSATSVLILPPTATV